VRITHSAARAAKLKCAEVRYPHATRGSFQIGKRYAMRAFLFFVAYFCFMLPCADTIAKADPEPFGAGFFLLTLGALTAIVFTIAYGLSAEWSNCTPSKIAAFVTGAVCALTFFGVLAFTHPTKSFMWPIATATLVGIGIAVSAPGWAPNRAIE
jgi:hypothetical protein